METQQPIGYSRSMQLAGELFTQYGLNEWRLEFSREKNTFGRCFYTKKLITLSKYHVEQNPEAVVKETLLHEIAHALSVTRHGIKLGKGHGWRWRQIAREVGAKPERCASHKMEVPRKYAATCSCCNKTYYRDRLSRYAKAGVSSYYCLKGGRELGKLTFKVQY